jgi:hypothetical protein
MEQTNGSIESLVRTRPAPLMNAKTLLKTSSYPQLQIEMEEATPTKNSIESLVGRK